MGGGRRTKETEKKILKDTMMEVQKVVKIESSRPYRMGEEVQDCNEVTENIGLGKGAEARGTRHEQEIGPMKRWEHKCHKWAEGKS